MRGPNRPGYTDREWLELDTHGDLAELPSPAVEPFKLSTKVNDLPTVARGYARRLTDDGEMPVGRAMQYARQAARKTFAQRFALMKLSGARNKSALAFSTGIVEHRREQSEL
jgi:hypothetical protein